jgi:hypothetical protein
MYCKVPVRYVQFVLALLLLVCHLYLVGTTIAALDCGGGVWW